MDVAGERHVLGMLKEVFSGDQWTTLLILSIPLWAPFVAFCCVGLWKGNAEVALLASGDLGIRRLIMSLGVFCAVSSIWRLLTPPGTFQSVLAKLAALTGAAKPPAVPTRARRLSTEIKPVARTAHQSPSASLGPVLKPQSSQPPARSATGASWAIRDEDLSAFKHRIDEGYKTEKWELVCEKKSDKADFISWRHILPHGGTEYLSRTVIQNSTAEALHAFYDDDKARMKWDNMLIFTETVDKCPVTGTEASLWVRNFPAWCSQRDYMFSRRNFSDGEYLWTVTKACLHPERPEKKVPRRVTEYFSSWRIRTVPGVDGKLSASECVLIHHEEMGIQQDMARWAIRSGMWPVIKKLVNGYLKFHTEYHAKKVMQGSSEIAAVDSSNLVSVTSHKPASTSEVSSKGRASIMLRRIATVGLVIVVSSLGKSRLHKAQRTCAQQKAVATACQQEVLSTEEVASD